MKLDHTIHVIGRWLSITHPTIARMSTQEPHVILILYGTAMYRNSVDMYTSPSVQFSSWATREGRMAGCVTHDGSYPDEERQSLHAIGQFTAAFACPINSHRPTRGIARQRSRMGGFKRTLGSNREGFNSPCQQLYHSPSLLGFPEAMVSV